MSDVARRIREVLELRGVSARELSRRAGLGETQVALLLKRLETKGGAQVTLPTLAAIAKGGAVSLAWLTTGEGSPDSDDATEPSHGDDEKPIRRNALGWDAALPVAKLLQPAWPEWAWEKAGASAPYMIDGPITPAQIVSLARTAMELASPEMLARQTARRPEIDAEEAEAMEAQKKLEAAYFARQKKAGGKR